jgi:hypothetical protein
MHKSQAIARAKRLLAEEPATPVYIVYCGCGNWTVKTQAVIDYYQSIGETVRCEPVTE